MQADRTARVVITRESAEVGKPGRVYVTGPHFSKGRGPYFEGAVFSSTRDRSEASTFERWVAEGMIQRKAWRLPEVEEA